MNTADKVSYSFERSKLLLTLQLLALASALLLWSQPGLSRVDDARSNAATAATLSAKYSALKNDLDNSQFQRPIHMSSSEGKDSVGGEIFAVLNSPFATTGSVLDKPAQWCDILLLHLNNKYCRAATDSKGTVLHVAVGTKGEQALKDAQQVDFVYRLAARTPEYLQVNLEAEQGPLSTHHYRIVLEAAPTDDGRTFIHFTYAYSFGMVGKLAMQAYLNTVARNKIGFTIVPDPAGGDLKPVGGMRGAVERNTMRYYLAIEAFLGAVSAPPAARMEKSLRDWFAATETYSRQLHEMNENEYLAIKRKEYSRQQSESNPKG
jgi:hypothetical protein